MVGLGEKALANLLFNFMLNLEKRHPPQLHSLAHTVLSRGSVLDEVPLHTEQRMENEVRATCRSAVTGPPKALHCGRTVRPSRKGFPTAQTSSDGRSLGHSGTSL